MSGGFKGEAAAVAMPDYDADVLIVGAGPAGAWAARQLGPRRRVGAADRRQPPPREAVRRGPDRAMRGDAGDVLARLPHVAVERVRFESPPVGRDPYPPAAAHAAIGHRRRAPAATRADPTSPLVVVSRLAFDAALVDDAPRGRRGPHPRARGGRARRRRRGRG